MALIIFRIFFVFFLIFTIESLSDEQQPANISLIIGPDRADTHAPVSIMGDHYHKQREVMFSYRYMFMNMDGYQKGSSSTGYDRARTKHSGGTTAMNSVYMNVPLDMEMKMHMLGGMYALSDDYTLMGMVNYHDNSMKVKKHSTGATKTLSSKGWGDTKLSIMRRLFESEIVKIHASLGVGLPTGSISKEDIMLSGSKGTLGYCMQLGSGTYDILPALTYFHTRRDFSFGLQTSAEIRTGENSKNYTLGDKYALNTWIAKPVTQINSSFSLGMKVESLGKVDGAHKDITSIMSFSQDPESTGYKKVDLSLGINLLTPYKGLRFGIEYLKPVYNKVNQVQLDTDYSLVFAAQHTLY